MMDYNNSLTQYLENRMNNFIRHCNFMYLCSNVVKIRVCFIRGKKIHFIFTAKFLRNNNYLLLTVRVTLKWRT